MREAPVEDKVSPVASPVDSPKRDLVAEMRAAPDVEERQALSVLCDHDITPELIKDTTPVCDTTTEERLLIDHMAGCTDAKQRAATLASGSVTGQEAESKLIDALLKHAPEWPGAVEQFMHITKSWYDTDVVSEEGILMWSSAVQSDAVAPQEEHRKQCLEKMQPFVQWLEDAEEESSDEE